MTTGLVYHDDYLKHRVVEAHPENPNRISTTMEHFVKTGLIDLVESITPEQAPLQDVSRVHSPEHIDYIKRMSEEGCGRFAIIDPDTYVSEDTYETALLSAGGVINAGEAVWEGRLDNCFALVRPPGHHASKNQATGFCYFDNISIMVRHLQANHGVKRVVIFDWDAHAPNGTMGTFYADPSVLNISIHQDPKNFYPGHGFIDQIGEGAGRGATINFPVPAGTADPDYLYFLDEFVVPRVKKFKPDLIAVAAGQDSHESDLISQLLVSDAGYAAMTQRLMALADEVCHGKLVLELEGGYNLKTLPTTHQTIVEALMAQTPTTKVAGEVKDSTRDLLDQLRDKLKSRTLWPEAPEPGEGEGACDPREQ